MLDDLIDRVWLIIYNKAREKNEIINIYVDKDKDIVGYVGIYNKIVNDKLEFVNKISESLNNAIEKNDFKNLEDDVLKLIGNSCMLKEKAVRKIIKKKIVMIVKIIIIITIIIIVMIIIMIIILMII